MALIDTMVWMKILVHLEEANQFKISRVLKFTYCHVSRVVKEIVDMGWATVVKKGRTKIYTLTPAGKEMRKHCLYILIGLGYNVERFNSIKHKTETFINKL